MRKKEEIKHLLQIAFYNKTLPIPMISKLKKSIIYVLSSLSDMDKKHENSESYQCFKEQLSLKVLKPYAEKAAFSRNWYKRYTASICYLQGINSKDHPIIIKLIEDKSFLVAIDAAKVATKFPTPKLINTLIDVYSKARHVRQSVYASLILQSAPDISFIIIERLEKEKNLYVKAFCYRLLSRLPKEKQTLFAMKEDLTSDCIDLKIAALKYISYLNQSRNNPLIYSLSEDLNWEVRAIAAKILGKVDTDKSIHILEQLLADESKWVKNNAAYSLVLHGKKGIAILKKQSKKVDEVAYEIAQEMLKELQQS